jgi:hypothetical protein
VGPVKTDVSEGKRCLNLQVKTRLTLLHSRYFFYPEDGGDTFLRTSIFTRPTRPNIPDDGILHSIMFHLLDTRILTEWRKEYVPLSEVSLLSPEDGSRSSTRNFVFYIYLEFRTMAEVQNRSDSECYTPASGPFRM